MYKLYMQKENSIWGWSHLRSLLDEIVSMRKLLQTIPCTIHLCGEIILMLIMHLMFSCSISKQNENIIGFLMILLLI